MKELEALTNKYDNLTAMHFPGLDERSRIAFPIHASTSRATKREINLICKTDQISGLLTWNSGIVYIHKLDGDEYVVGLGLRFDSQGINTPRLARFADWIMTNVDRKISMFADDDRFALESRPDGSPTSTIIYHNDLDQPTLSFNVSCIQSILNGQENQQPLHQRIAPIERHSRFLMNNLHRISKEPFLTPDLTFFPS